MLFSLPMSIQIIQRGRGFIQKVYIPVYASEGTWKGMLKQVERSKKIISE